MNRISPAAGALARLPACLALAVLAQPAHAQAPYHDDAHTLDTLVVTAAAPRSALHWVTDPRLPRQPVPASDGADYLKTVPGFAAVRNGGTNGDPVLRGMFGSRLNILSNDGNLIGACPSRMDNPLSYISPETYDRLTIIKGPQSVRWGAGASAGTIRLERDTPRFDTAGLRAEGSALAGSRNRNDQVLDLTAGMPQGYVRASGNRSESDDYHDGRGQVVPSKWRKWNGDVAVGWTPDPDTLLEISAGAGDAIARYAGRGMDGAMFKRTSHAARFEKRNLPGAWDRIDANVYDNVADHVMDNYTLRTPNPASSMPMPMASNVDRRTRGGRVSAEWRWQDVAVVAGVDAEDSRHRGRNAMGRGAYRALPKTTDAQFRRQGVFSEMTLGADTGKRWISGLRIDRARVHDLRRSLGSGMMAVPNPSFDARRQQWLGSGFVRHERDLQGGLTWYAGLGRSARMPDYWELFSPNQGPQGAVNAFTAIAPERTTQLDIGLQFRTAQLQAWVSAYAGRLDDYILFTYRDGGMMGSTSQADNVQARIAGAEAGASWQMAEQWLLGGSLAYAWGENRDTGRPLPQMPPLEARLNLEWQGQDWSAGALLRGVTAQHRVAPGQGNVVARDLGPSAGFATLALNAAYRVTPALRVSAGVDNVFDRYYSEHLNLAGSADFGFPAEPVRIAEPGRTAWLKLDYRY